MRKFSFWCFMLCVLFISSVIDINYFVHIHTLEINSTFSSLIEPRERAYHDEDFVGEKLLLLFDDNTHVCNPRSSNKDLFLMAIKLDFFSHFAISLVIKSGIIILFWQRARLCGPLLISFSLTRSWRCQFRGFIKNFLFLIKKILLLAMNPREKNLNFLKIYTSLT